ncbi:hypothetical protein IAR50_007002 [Cryptococcus sp. DSM 104548]
MSGHIGQVHWGAATALLGLHPSHKLEEKFQELQKAGFKYYEVLTADYFTWVREQEPDLPKSTCPPAWSMHGEPDPSDDEIWTALYTYAPKFTALAANYGLKCIVLQPFNHFDGWPEGHEREEWAKRKAERWVKLCSELEIEYIQVGGNDQKEATAGDEKTAADLRWIADLGAKQNPVVKIAYECWCFGARSDWEYTWKIMQIANHPNIGLCLDAAQFALSPTYGYDILGGKGWSDSKYTAMLSRLSALPKESIAYVEISDVLEPSPPLYGGSPFDKQAIEEDKGDGRERNAIEKWCGYARPLPLVGPNAGLGDGPDGGEEARKVGERDSARVVGTLEAIFSTGWRGHCMFEVFESKYIAAEDPSVPRRYAQACKKSLELLKFALKDSLK